MNTVSQEDVFYVASLANIAITDDEANALTQDLNNILGYVKQLGEVDTDNLEPTYQVNGLKNVTREDTIIDYGADQKALLQNAAATESGQLKVPRVL